MRRAAERVAGGLHRRPRGAAPTRPAWSGTAPRPTPAAGSPPSTSATRPLCFGRLDLLPRRPDLRAPTAPLLHRPHLGRRRRPHAAGHRLARAGRRAVLPGDRGRADGRRPPPPLHHPTAASWSASTTRCSTPTPPRRPGFTVVGEGALLAALDRDRTGRMARHRRHHPGRAGRSDPAPSSPAILVVGRRSRHRQDRGRAAPRRVPPLHAPQAARVAGRAARRAEPDLPALHRQVLPSLGEHDVQLADARRAEAAAAGARRPSRRRSRR